MMKRLVFHRIKPSLFKPSLLALLIVLAYGAPAQGQQTNTAEFLITIRNLSGPDTFYTVNPSPLGQAVWVLHTFRDPLFTVGRRMRNNGLEALAEDANATFVAEAVSLQVGVQQSGVFPISPLRPSEMTRVRVNAYPGQRLSIAIMLMESNDKFYATPSEGLPLFTTNGMPLKGDITTHLMLFDAGTEFDEDPGRGINQPIRQRDGQQGTPQKAPIRQVKQGPTVDRDGYRYPIISEQIQITIE